MPRMQENVGCLHELLSADLHLWWSQLDVSMMVHIVQRRDQLLLRLPRPRLQLPAAIEAACAPSKSSLRQRNLCCERAQAPGA